MDSAAEGTPGARRPLLWPGYFVGGLGLTLASFVVASFAGDFVSQWNSPRLKTLFYGVVLLAPFAKAGHLCVKRYGTGMSCPWFAFTMGAAFPWVLAMGILFTPGLVEYAGRTEFDAAAWKRAEADGSQDRIKMVDDLIDSERLDNLPRAGVEELLGPDDSASGYFSDWDAVYWLGRERGFMSIDSEWLVIRYGDDARVGEYRIVRD